MNLNENIPYSLISAWVLSTLHVGMLWENVLWMAPADTTQDWGLRYSWALATMNFAVKISFHQDTVNSFSDEDKM